MYFGSVKFFKHLIYTVFTLFITAIVLTLLWLGLGYFDLLPDYLKFGIDIFPEKEIITEETNDVSLSEVIDDLHAEGFDTDTILDAIMIDDPIGAKEFAQEFAEEIVGGEIPETPETPVEPIVTEAPTLTELIDPDLSAPAYQKLYPDLYTDPPTEFIIDTGAAYLTFDDGPSSHTEDILYILDSYGVKATFFFSGGESEADKETMKRAADEGHTIGVHSLSHNYTEVYASVESFLEDFNNTYQNVFDATGIKPQIFRFAGGSINNYNRFVYKEIIAEMTRRGFVYYDWNVSGADAVEGATWTSIYRSVVDGAEPHINDRAIILLHDSKSRTVTVVEDVIDELTRMGYHFEPLSHDIMPVTFAYVS
ncbi:MAG: polysaccharide deacetylase [Ruminococcus sp.]|jgi:peptidoglycan/xylan/chitin deacetylase (PgdA/CDA1 family)|nr:polysaccharide deacetylase [Ruminococcus sp.]